MAELNLDYYTAKDHYSDGDIEETLLKMAQEGKSFEDLPEDEVSFPMVYHFSGPVSYTHLTLPTNSLV